MTVYVTKKEIELHAIINVQIQNKYPDLTQAQLTWLDDAIWKFMKGNGFHGEMDPNELYKLCLSYTTNILTNPILSANYVFPKNLHCNR